MDTSEPTTVSMRVGAPALAATGSARFQLRAFYRYPARRAPGDCPDPPGVSGGA